MRELSDAELRRRLAFDNPWWGEGGRVASTYRAMPHRGYFDAFRSRVAQRSVRRAVVLEGLRRVGKTVMLQQCIDALLQGDTPPERIFYVSLDTPIYKGLWLERLLRLFMEIHGHGLDVPLWVFFDEVQYLEDWQVHLKSLVDSYPSVKSVVSGSATAALRRGRRESGAGRFTEFELPPLTFAEFLRLRGLEEELVFPIANPFGAWFPFYDSPDIERLNAAFVDYLSYGGFPEAVVSDVVRNEADLFLASDVLDNVLLHDLPSLYGIADVQELSNVFTKLALNTAGEVSYEALAASSGIAKNTLRRYIEYLEAAFLLRKVHRVDKAGRRLRKQVKFKVYLTAPSLRTALLGAARDERDLGALAETAVFTQWMHASAIFRQLYYARWPEGEVDLVKIGPRPWALEAKWSDRYFERPDELRGLIAFAQRNGLADGCFATTRTKSGFTPVRGVRIYQEPCALQCYRVGRHATAALRPADRLFEAGAAWLG